jgi:hypothetical protein
MVSGTVHGHLSLLGRQWVKLKLFEGENVFWRVVKDFGKWCRMIVRSSIFLLSVC